MLLSSLCIPCLPLVRSRTSETRNSIHHVTRQYDVQSTDNPLNPLLRNNGQPSPRIEHADLHKHTSLVPVKIQTRHAAGAETAHQDERDLHEAVGGRDAREQPGDGGGVGEGEEGFVDDAVGADGAG